MLIKDLTDERDREHCRRAERAPSIRSFAIKYRGRAGFLDRPIPNHDKIANEEFNSGIPHMSQSSFEMHDDQNFPVVELRGNHEPI